MLSLLKDNNENILQIFSSEVSNADIQKWCIINKDLFKLNESYSCYVELSNNVIEILGDEDYKELFITQFEPLTNQTIFS
jgi:hypothetical protein